MDAPLPNRATPEIERAAQTLRSGGAVAFPSETVYGLGADAGDAEAVRRVFALKGRPPSNPVIVHVSSKMMARRVVSTWSDDAERLARAFWPGPLTLVLPKAPGVPDEVTAGGATVGVRAPDHPIALALLHAFNAPIIGPSANPSGGVSPTTAEHVRTAFGDRVQVLEGGACAAGIESTVLDLVAAMPTVLRPGVIGAQAIEHALGKRVAQRHEDARGAPPPGAAERSPGRHGAHYRPSTPVRLIAAGERASLPAGAVVLRLGGIEHPAGEGEIEMPEAAQAYARRLYAALREADGRSPTLIAVERPDVEGGSDPASRAVWEAALERLGRAATQD